MLDDLKRSFNTIDLQKQELAKAIELLENCKFKVGDIVVHKEYGRCVVIDFYLKNSPHRLDRASPCLADDADMEIGYILTSTEWDIYQPIAEKDLMPYNKATKTLY